MDNDATVAAKPKNAVKVKSGKAKALGLKQLFAKKYKLLEGLPEHVMRSFGQMTEQILMIIYGPSGNGKSRMTMMLLKVFMMYGDVLYWGLEEGHRRTMQKNAQENLNEEDHSGRIVFYDHNLTYDELVVKLKKKRSPQFIVVDSIQYCKLTIDQYKFLKEQFPKKGFIYISHSKGKYPMGKLAGDIEYDVDIKVRVEGFVAFVKSRHGGNKPFIIWEEGAIDFWKKRKVNQFKK